MRKRFDVVVVGSGPNGLTAALTMAMAGRSVAVIESEQTAGGGTRTKPLTLPGYRHDVCSAIHALGVCSPAFRSLGLHERVQWIEPPIALAHPFDDGTAAAISRSIADTCRGLGADGSAYRTLVEPIASQWARLSGDLLGPLSWPRDPIGMARFGLHAVQSAAGLAKRHFRDAKTKALFAGVAAHAIMPLEQPLTSAIGLVLSALAHVGGWPVAAGGSQTIADALLEAIRSRGGVFIPGTRVDSLEQLPAGKAILLDVSPRALDRLAGDRLPSGYRRCLQRYRYGPGVWKVDWALNGPVPWTAVACRQAGTVHVGGTLEEIAQSERLIWQGQPPQRPFVLVAQQSLFDPTRAPAGHHTLWGYCHVPHASTVEMTEAIETQIERFAPGFKRLILARHVLSPADLEQYNPNNIGGDITGGVQDLWQLYARPAPRLVPYATPLRGIYLCSSSTPPGAGVHGMCGWHAARIALRREFGIRVP